MSPTNSINPLSHEDWFRIVTSSMPSIAWATDTELRFTWSVGPGLKMLGLQPNQIVGVSLYEYFQDDDPASRPMKMHFQALAGRRVNYTQMWGDRYYQTYLEPLRDEQGEITGCVGIAFDIGASSAFLHSQGTTSLSRIAFRESPLPMVVCEQGSLNVKMVNNQFLQVTGFQHQQVAGKPLSSLSCWVNAEELAPLLNIEPDGALIDGTTCQLRRVADKAIAGQSDSNQPITATYCARAFELEGEPHLIVTLDTNAVHDELAEAVQKVADFEEYAKIVPAMLYQIRGKNDSTAVSLDYVSPYITELTGLEPGAVYDDVTQLIDAIHPDDQGRYYTDALKAVEDFTSFEIEMRMVSKTGEARWVRAMSRPRATEDGIVFYGVCLDVHELKTREFEQEKSLKSLSKLRHDEKMWAEQRNRGVKAEAAESRREAQRAVAANDLLLKTVEFQEKEKRLLSYELHDGLVQNIVGASYTLQGMQARMGDDPDYTDDLSLLRRSLDAASEEARRLVREMRPKTMEHDNVVDAINSMIREEEAGGGFLIEFNHNDIGQLPPVIAAGAMRIIQEAVTNARRHSQTDSCQVMVMHTGSELSLTIEDEGAGFDTTATPTNRYGLESIRERARIFGGEATIESKPGQGTRVNVRLPAAIIESLV